MRPHGVLLARAFAESLRGLPAPLVTTRLLLLLMDALGEIPEERAVELVAESICDAECRGCDTCDPEYCMEECTASKTAELRRLLREAGSRG